VDRLSFSAIGTFLSQGPAYFRKSRDKEIDPIEGDHLDLGSAVHCYLLDPHCFEDNFIVSDVKISGKMGLLLKTLADCGDFSEECLKKAYNKAGYKKGFEDIKTQIFEGKDNKRYEEYYKTLKAKSKNKIVIDSKTSSYAKYLSEKAKEHKGVRKVLMMDSLDFDKKIDTFNEYVIKFNYRDYSFIAILDNLQIDWENKMVRINDLKTTSKPLDNFGLGSFIYYRYYLQLAIYKKAVEQLIFDAGYNPSDFLWQFNIICVQTGGLASVKVFNINLDWISKGEIELECALDELKWHYDNNVWDYPRSYYESGGIDFI
jgi:hypothetical protein